MEMVSEARKLLNDWIFQRSTTSALHLDSVHCWFFSSWTYFWSWSCAASVNWFKNTVDGRLCVGLLTSFMSRSFHDEQVSGSSGGNRTVLMSRILFSIMWSDGCFVYVEEKVAAGLLREASNICWIEISRFTEVWEAVRVRFGQNYTVWCHTFPGLLSVSYSTVLA